MHTGPTTELRSVFRVIGSLWFAAVIMVLLLVAMGCATVFESMRSPSEALALFYHAWWFEVLLGLLALNVAAAMAARYPFNKRQVGFVLTHGGILLTLAGALITKHWGLDGQMAIQEGRSNSAFAVSVPVITLANRAQQTTTTLELSPSRYAGFDPIESIAGESTSLQNVQVQVVGYVPDSVLSEEFVNDNPRLSQAVRLSLSPDGRENAAWMFANRAVRIGPFTVLYRSVADPAQLQRLLANSPDAGEDKDGVVHLAVGDAKFDIPLKSCQQNEVPIGDTGFSLRVVRYLPHATVGPESKLANLSDQPVNPAIEVELIGPDGRETRKAFSRFPDFSAMHGDTTTKNIKLTFTAPQSNKPSTPIEIISGPDAKLYVRFQAGQHAPSISTQELTLGTTVDTPWPNQKLTVFQQMDHARVSHKVEPTQEERKQRTPAVRLAVSSAGDTQELWIQRYTRPYPVSIQGVPYELSFHDKQIPIGFDLRLDDFKIVYYPGTMRPRSFESHLTILDPIVGGEQSRVISMNHPVKHGGFNFYQSSYRDDVDPPVTILSVSRDPGIIVAFTGYVAIFIGMCVVLGIRMSEHRRIDGGAAGNVQAGSPAQLLADLQNRSVPRRNNKNEGSHGEPTGQGKRPGGKPIELQR